jgi:hypothetical protein
MTDLKKAAQQALEALEDLLVWHSKNSRAITAITALKAALVEEALQRLTDVHQEIEAALAAPVQEPFGYLWPTGRHPEFRFTQQKRDGVDGMPLYTTPPQRKPLTKESLLYIYNQLPNWGMDMDRLPQGLEKFARAIEAAHNIKENT